MNVTATDPIAVPLERELQRLRQLQAEGQYAATLPSALALLEDSPDHGEVLYLVARSQRYLGQIDAALQTLANMEQHHPRYSRLHEERGHCYVVRRDAPNAINALLHAVNINPALPSSWNLLEGLYRMTGDTANAAIAASHVATLKRLAPDVVRATSYFSDGEFELAEQIIRRYLLQAGNDVEAMRLLARIGLAREVFDDAQTLLEAVLTIAPDYRAARYDYACVLLERHLYQRACEEAQTLLAIEPNHPDYRALYASASVGVGEHDRAIALYQQLLQQAPGAADLQLSLAHSLKAQGRQGEAIAAYQAAAAARPDFGDAYWSLANLKTYRFSDDDLDCMRAAQASPETATVDRYHLAFALGKACEDRGEYAESWRYYEQGNALKRAESRYRPDIIEGNTRRQIQTCTREFFAARSGVGDTRPDPIFIVGLPRSGSTLIEQILASHSQVEGTHELGEIPRMVLDLQGREDHVDDPRYPGVLSEMTASDFLSRQQAVLHRQDAEQFSAHRLDPSDSAQRQNHRRPARARRLLFQQSEAAFCQRPGIYLQHRRHRALLPDVSGSDAALGRCAARTRAARNARKRGRRSGRQRAADPGFLRSGVRAGLSGISQDRAQRAHGELRTGAPADFSRWHRPVEALRSVAESVERSPRRCSGAIRLDKHRA
jgi:tetratricopeptide (TPR) repeat protein